MCGTRKWRVGRGLFPGGVSLVVLAPWGCGRLAGSLSVRVMLAWGDIPGCGAWSEANNRKPHANRGVLHGSAGHVAFGLAASRSVPAGAVAYAGETLRGQSPGRSAGRAWCPGCGTPRVRRVP